jgi:hypothetical protein
MAVCVQMDSAVTVRMRVKMYAIAPEPPKHMRAEADQHDPHAGLDGTRKLFRDRVPQEDGDAGKNQQGDGVAEPPGEAMLDDVADFGAARRNRGDRRDMVGLERVLHAQQKTQPQDSEHTRCAPFVPRLAAHSSHRFESAGKDRKTETSAAAQTEKAPEAAARSRLFQALRAGNSAPASHDLPGLQR